MNPQSSWKIVAIARHGLRHQHAAGKPVLCHDLALLSLQGWQSALEKYQGVWYLGSAAVECENGLFPERACLPSGD
jgi:hypothetical protein